MLLGEHYNPTLFRIKMQNKKRRRATASWSAAVTVMTSGRRQSGAFDLKRVEDVLLDHQEARLQSFRQAHLDAVTLPLVSMARPEEVILVEHLLRCHLGEGLVVVEALMLQRFDTENNLHSDFSFVVGVGIHPAHTTLPYFHQICKKSTKCDL